MSVSFKFFGPKEPYGGPLIATCWICQETWPICQSLQHPTGTLLIFVMSKPTVFLMPSFNSLHLTGPFVLLKWLPWLIASLSHQPCMFTLTCLSAEFQMLIDVNNSQSSGGDELYAILLTHWRRFSKKCLAWR